MFFGGVDLPAMGGKLINFFFALPPSSKEVENHFKTMTEQAQCLCELFQSIIDKIEGERSAIADASEINITANCCVPNKVLWAQKKYKRVFIKYHEAKQQRLTERHQEVTQVLCFLRAALTARAPVMFRLDDFIKTVSIDEDPVLRAFEWKMMALVNYIKKNTIPKKDHKQWMDELHEALREASKDVIMSIEYSPMGRFDDLFLEWTLQKQLIKKFDQLIESMPHIGRTKHTKKEKPEPTAQRPRERRLTTPDDFSLIDESVFSNDIGITEIEPEPKDDPFANLPKSVNFSEFDKFAHFFYMCLGGNQMNKRDFIVMRCAAIRILFDRYFQENDAIMGSEPSSQAYLDRCQEILSSTPTELEMSKVIFGELICNEAIGNIMKGNALYYSACAYISIAEMMTNPLDMSYYLFLAMKETETASRLYAMVQVGDKAADKGFDLGFDDIFSMFMPAFALCPLVSPNSVARFLDLFKNLKISQNLDYARVSAHASILHISGQDT